MNIGIRRAYEGTYKGMGWSWLVLVTFLHINKCGVKGVHDKMKGHNGR